MCGRFSLTSPVEAMRNLFGFNQSPNLMPRYNIPPSTQIAAVRLAENSDEATTDLFFAHWGLVPSWAKSPEFSVKMINARSETVREKPAFREAFKARRCLIPTTGFYEWQTSEKREKQPWFIGLSEHKLFAFAGLWESWKTPDGEDLESCTILTMPAAENISFIHHRMPVMLDTKDYRNWLEGIDDGYLASLSPDNLSFYPVSGRVGNVRNDDPELMVETEVQGPAQQELF
ncbi:MAG: SOS response-associated peptidase [Proteobacteria bacterium]|nr:SOS response-associated peptidase [Pseudomonadota bacterium]